MGKMSGGAHLSFTVAGVTLQPSEFVKIIFVFFVACMLYEATDFRQVCITTIAAAVHVGILVLSNRSWCGIDFFPDLCGNAVCGNAEAGCTFFGGLGVGCLAALVRFEAVFSCAGAYRSMERSFCVDSWRRMAGGTGAVCHWNRRMVWSWDCIRECRIRFRLDHLISCLRPFLRRLGGAFAVCIVLVCFSCFPDVFEYRDADPGSVL